MSLYIFDRDGTLTVTKSGRPCPNSLSDQQKCGKVEKILGQLKEQGHLLAICSNQGGVSCGYLTPYEAWLIADETNRLFGRIFDDVVLSFYHPCGKDRNYYFDDAKPRPTMILQLMDRHGFLTSQTHFVGNAFTDREAAKRAKVDFHWAHKFFAWGHTAVVANEHGYHPTSWFERNKRFKETRCEAKQR